MWRKSLWRKNDKYGVCLESVRGGYGGSPGPKIVTFWEPHLGSKILNLGLYELKTLVFSRFLAKNSPSGDQKWPFFG